MKRFLAVVIFLFASLCYAQQSLNSNFVIIEEAMPHNLNPHETAYAFDAQVLDGLYEGLFTYNPVTLEPQYAIACDYKISRNKKRWTFTIRQNALFSNGEPITAESVRFSWLELLKNPNAPYASLLEIVQGATDFRNGKGTAEDVGIYVIDDYTLSVYLNSPANYLPKILCHYSFAIIHRNPTVYSGAYVLDELQDGLLVLKKNPYYWDFANTRMEKITFVQSSDAAENAYYFNTGAVDWVSSEFDGSSVINNKNIQYSAQFGTSYFFFKLSNKKPEIKSKVQIWDYEEFRNALLEAWPWEKINKFLIQATTFVYPLTDYPAVEGFEFSDSIEAGRMFEAARKKYGIPVDEILDLNFEISEYALSEENQELIKETLKPFGVNVNFIMLNPYAYLQNVPYSSSDLFGYTWIGDFADPLAFLELFHGNSSLNDSGWKNEKYDLLLEQAELVSGAERYKLLAEAETILLDSGMIIPYYHPVSANLINLEATGGWATNAFDIHPLKYIFKKETKSNVPNIVMR